MPWSYVEAKAVIKARTGITYSARVRDNLGGYLTRADIASIARSVFRIRTAAAVSAEHTAFAILPNDAIYDTLQGADGTDPRWDVDTIGWNFRDMIASVSGSYPFPDDDNFLVEYWLTPVAGRGDPFPLSIVVEATRRFAA